MTQPNILTVPFAESAASQTIQEIPISRDPSDPIQKASWSTGFPAATMQPLATGGVPPMGQDFNGILKALSEHIVYMGSGGLYRWSDAWVAAKGGYPLGAVLQSNDGRSAYVNIVEGNAVNFNTTPASIGVSWLPFAGNGALSGKVDKTTQVIAGTGISGGGDLSTNRTLSVIYGTTAGTAAQGNDSRIVNAASKTYTDTELSKKRDITNSTFDTSVSGNDIKLTSSHDSVSLFLQGDTSRGLYHTRASGAQNYYLLLPDKSGTLATTEELIGVDQSWQNMTASRAAGTTYTNTTGRVIQVSVCVIDASDSGVSEFFINGNIVSRSNGTPSVSNRSNWEFVIPPGSNYMATAPQGIELWWELR